MDVVKLIYQFIKALRELGDKDSTIDGIVIVKPLVESST